MNMIVHDAILASRDTVAESIEEWLYTRAQHALGMGWKEAWVPDAVEQSAGEASAEASRVIEDDVSIEKAVDAGFEKFFEVLLRFFEERSEEGEFDASGVVEEVRSVLAQEAGYQDVV